MKVLTDSQAQTLIAFLESFDLRVTGAWRDVEEGMREDFGIDDPETALEEVKAELQK